MKYLITGGTGFIGRNLTNLLQSMGEDFTIIDKRPRGNPDVIVDNVCQPISAPEGEIFIHLAAETSVRDSLANPSKVFIDNCKGTLNCLEFAADSGYLGFIFASSSSAPSAHSPYLASKFSCEQLCKAYKNSFGLSFVIFRLSNVYGPYSTHKESVIHRFIKNCIDHQPLIIFGNGGQVRDFIYVGDVVKNIYEAPIGIQSTYELISGKSQSINSIAALISSISNKLINFTPEILYTDEVPGEIRQPKALLGISNPTPIHKGIESTFKWYLENYNVK